MLESCPYYTKCDAEIRQIRGSNEHFCLGSKNWEFCPEFKNLSLGGEISREYSRDPELEEIVKNSIAKDLMLEYQSQIILALISNQGEVLFRDRHWSETDLLVAQNLCRYKTDSLNFGDFIKLEEKEYFLFLKIHEFLMLVCHTKLDSEPLVEIITRNLQNYHAMLDDYLKKCPISFEEDLGDKIEENAVLSMFEDLQTRLEALNPDIVIRDLQRIKDKISDLFSWNRISYEVSILIERLKSYPVHTELNHQEREDILEKIRDWQENIRKTS